MKEGTKVGRSLYTNHAIQAGTWAPTQISCNVSVNGRGELKHDDIVIFLSKTPLELKPLH